jgi:triacylglycerol lipase
MASICAGRCKLSYIRSNPRGLYTFGSPRIGNRPYVKYVHMEAYRWVNNNDIITRLPPEWLGYRHKGQEIYLNAYGQIRRLTPWQRVKDRWRGFVRGLREGRFDHFSDHAIECYIEHIRRAVAEEENPIDRLRIPQIDRPQMVPMPIRKAA